MWPAGQASVPPHLSVSVSSFFIFTIAIRPYCTRTPDHTFPGPVYVFTWTIFLLYTTHSTGLLFFIIPPLCINRFVSPSVSLSHLVISLTLPDPEQAPS